MLGKLGLEALESRRMLAAHIVVDENTGGQAVPPSAATTASGGNIYFSAEDQDHGMELWATDGTTGGSHLVKDVVPGPQESNPRELVDVNGTLLFFADDDQGGVSLWKSDGTESGTVLIKSGFTDLESPAAVGSSVYFLNIDSDGNAALWTSDGTATGTHQVFDNADMDIDSGPGLPTAYNGACYFLAQVPVTEDGSATELWVTDGTAAGTHAVTDHSQPGGPSEVRYGTLCLFEGYLYFAADDTSGNSDLWRTDGSAVTRMSNTGAYSIRDVRAAADGLYFDTSSGQLWRTRGVPGDVEQVVDNPNAYEFWPTRPDGKVLLGAIDSAHGAELWEASGTANDAHLLKDLWPGTPYAAPQFVANFGDYTYFAANTGFNASNLWQTDGTEAGTIVVPGSNAGAPYATPGPTTMIGGSLYFTMADSNNGSALWKITTPGAAPQLIVRLTTRTLGSDPRPEFVTDDRLFWETFENTNSTFETTDGTPQGLADLGVKPGSTTWLRDHADTINGVTFFVGSDADHGQELWKTDGTVAGTSMVMDINPGPGDAGIFALEVYHGRLYFTVNAPTPNQIWTSDGTAAGTHELIGGYTGAGYGTTAFGLAGDRLLLIVQRDDESSDLWSTDGTSGGTQLIHLSDVSYSLFVTGYLGQVNGRAVFEMSDAAHGQELWTTDGTSAGTHLLKDVTPGTDGTYIQRWVVSGPDIYFIVADQSGRSRQLWKTDGTASGTGEIEDLGTAALGEETWLLSFKGDIYFKSSVVNALCKTDGTRGAAVEVAGTEGMTFTSMAAAGDFLYMDVQSVDDAYTGTLFRTDGVTTSAVSGIKFLGERFDPDLTNLNGTLYFAYDDGWHGREMWMLDETGPHIDAASVGSGGSTLSVTFSEKPLASSLDASDLLITPLAGGSAVTPSSVTFDAATKTATFSFTGALASGIYHVSLAAGAMTDAEGNTASGDADVVYLAPGDHLNIGPAGLALAHPTASEDDIVSLIASGKIVTSQGGKVVGEATGASALGLAGSRTALWHGETVSASSILLRSTWAGDADLDQDVDADDYFVIDRGYSRISTRYSQGDFNYDGMVNGDDYFLIDSSFSSAHAPALAAPLHLAGAELPSFDDLLSADATKKTDVLAIGDSDELL